MQSLVVSSTTGGYMKVLSVLALTGVLLYSGFAAGRHVGHAVVEYRPCDQQDYDEVYKQIILDTIDEYDHEPWRAIQIKNDSITKLRHICHGQRSTYETDRPDYLIARGDS